MKLQVKKGSADVTVYVFIADATASAGTGLTGLVHNSAGLTCYYVRPLGSATQLTLATQTVTGAHSDGGFVEVSSTNMPGVYRLDLSDAIVATGVDSVVVMLKGATNMPPVLLELQLVAYDPQDATSLGLSRLDAAVSADSSGVTTLLSRLSSTRAGYLDNLNGHVPQTGDSYARLGAPAGASVSADVAAVKTETASIQADTNDIQSRLPAALVSGRIDASVGAMASNTLTAAAVAADVTTELQAGLATAASLTSVASDITAVKAKTDNLPADPADASDIAASFTTVNGKLDTIDDFLDTEVAAIKAKTDNLPADPADASDLAASFSTVNTTLSTISGYIDTEVAAIKAKTDNLPASPAAVGSAMTLATDSVNAAAIAADAVTEIQSGLATPAQVLTQVNTALSAARTELASVPTTTGGLAEKIDFIFEYFRNRKTVTATTETLFKEDASTALATATISDNGTTFVKGEMS